MIFLFIIIFYFASFLFPQNYLELNQTEQTIKIISIQKKQSKNMKAMMSRGVENIILDDNLKIKDLLEQNATFSYKYSLYLNSLDIIERYKNEDMYMYILEIPFRGKYGFYHILPLNGKKEEHYKTNIKQNSSYQHPNSQASFLSNKLPVEYAGLIIDARHLNDFEYSLLPKIMSHDNFIIYDYNSIDPKKITQQGLLQFVKRMEDVSFYSNSLRVLALRASGKNYKTNIILSNEDVHKFYSHPNNLKQLQKGNIAIIR